MPTRPRLTSSPAKSPMSPTHRRMSESVVMDIEHAAKEAQLLHVNDDGTASVSALSVSFHQRLSPIFQRTHSNPNLHDGRICMRNFCAKQNSQTIRRHNSLQTCRRTAVAVRRSCAIDA